MQRCILHITTLFVLPILSFFISSQVNKASAFDTVDLGSITGLVIPKLEKSLYSHPASRLNISNKIGRVKLVGKRQTFLEKLTIFSLSVDNLVNKNAITSNLRKKLPKCVGRIVVNVDFFKLFFGQFFTDFES